MNVWIFALFVSFMFLTQGLLSSAFMTNSEEENQGEDDYADVARFLYFARKRSCIKWGLSCDHRPDDCCPNSSCRCNLWGTNCRCQRMGLFQKWGR